MHDYVIVGGGPAGLTAAWYLAKYGKRVLIIEREESLGGCHRVKRTKDGLFTEHSPRVYFGNYLQFQALLKDIGTDFNDVFTKYDFYKGGLYYIKASKISLCELMTFASEYIKFMFNKDYYKNITVDKFMSKHKFSDRTKLYTDLLCRIIDGAGADRFTLYELFKTVNISSLYNIFIPRYPNDQKLFLKWKDALLKTGKVDIMLNTKVVKLNYASNQIINLITNKGDKIVGDRFILAVPPLNIIDIISRSINKVKNSFGQFDDFNRWASYTDYITCVSVTFHWDKALKLDHVWGGLTDPEWGLIFINMSEYMTFNHIQSKTVISTTVTVTDKVAKYIGKTANNCTEDELKSTILHKLKQSYPGLPNPTRSVLSPETYHDGNVWINRDRAFMYTNRGYMSNRSNISNLYTVGPHTGILDNNYNYYLESAVTNAAILVNDLLPEATIKIREPWTLNCIVFIIIFILIIVYVCLRQLKKN